MSLPPALCAAALALMVAACGRSQAGNPRPAGAPPANDAANLIAVAPPGTLTVRQALAAPDRVPIRVLAWGWMRSPDCPPCPATAVCTPCPPPSAVFSERPYEYDGDDPGMIIEVRFADTQEATDGSWLETGLYLVEGMWAPPLAPQLPRVLEVESYLPFSSAPPPPPDQK
jgi:hypothetical protein